MNASGQTARALADYYHVRPDHLLVVHDDKDLTLGTLKLQHGRGSAGHRGVRSIIEALKNQSFWRLRLGVGSPPPDTATDTFVLQPFTKTEEKQLSTDILPRALAKLIAAVHGETR